MTATGFIGSFTLKGKNDGNPILVLVTNNHVFQTLEQALKASYQFGYHTDSEKWQPDLIKGEDLIYNNEDYFFTHHAQVKFLLYSSFTCS